MKCKLDGVGMRVDGMRHTDMNGELLRSGYGRPLTSVHTKSLIEMVMQQWLDFLTSDYVFNDYSYATRHYDMANSIGKSL